MRGTRRWLLPCLALLAMAGCSSLSDRDMLLDAGAFHVVPIPLNNGEHEPIGASLVAVDPASHVVYVAGDELDSLAVVDGLAAHLVQYAAVRPDGERGEPAEGLMPLAAGGAVLVRLPDYDGVPVMVHVGGEPDYVLSAEAGQVGSDEADGLPRRLMIASEEAGIVLLADMTPWGIDFQCLIIGDHPTLICPQPIDGEFPVDLTYDAHQRTAMLLTATDAYTSRLRVYGASGELRSWTFPGGPVEGQVLVEESDGSIYVLQRHIDAIHRLPADGGDPQPLMVEAGPIEMVQDPTSGKLYVACRDSDSVVVVDPQTGESETIVLPDSPVGLAIDPVAGYLFVGLRESRDLAVVDLPSLLVSAVDVGGPQRDVTVDPAVRLVYAVRNGGVLARMAY
jgi:YVTN family beta-propeller protein